MVTGLALLNDPWTDLQLFEAELTYVLVVSFAGAQQ